MPDIKVTGPGMLLFQGNTYRCALGEKGVTPDHKEGDKATPIGSFALRECWYRADKMAAPETILKLRVITQKDGWCDAPNHADYNRHVTLPFAASHETLWREDSMYDIVVPLGFNDDSPVPGKGSAIFLHLAQPGYLPTLGCVAVSLADMQRLLAGITAGSRLIVAAF